MSDTIQSPSFEYTPNIVFEKPQAKLYHQIEVQGKKSFQCLMAGCEKIFKFKCDMERHTLTHTKEKPIVCPYPSCNKSFKRSDALKNHVETMHVNYKVFVCPIPGCGFQVDKKDSLKLHLAKHDCIRKLAMSNPDDGKIDVPWKKNADWDKRSDWEKRFWAQHKAEQKNMSQGLLSLPEGGLEDLKEGWDILSCLEEGESEVSQKFFERLESWKKRDLVSISRDSSDTLSLRSFRDESPCLISGARDLLRSICKEMGKENTDKVELLGLPQDKPKGENDIKSPVSEVFDFEFDVGTPPVFSTK